MLTDVEQREQMYLYLKNVNLKNKSSFKEKKKKDAIHRA